MIIGEAGEAVKAVWGDALLANPGHVYGGGKPTSGRFEMDPQELQTVIGLWQDELGKIVDDGQKIDLVISSLQPPGGDSASGSFVSSGLDSLTALQKQNESMRKYVSDYIQKLTTAKNAILVTDAAMSDPFKTT